MDLANGEQPGGWHPAISRNWRWGWATYNGDHMSMYGVNAGVPKTLVRYLVGYEADRCGGETEQGAAGYSRHAGQPRTASA